ncbi:uncharacterized protein BX663DRAFT_550636 [Cokeromyces recurvatus]|uniref:uncharacterized protein n=1 Tax=Cokeromyces recurvatus TaxID=90255 RepID=UPI00221F2A5A|nr:uncharacterized protein BX663DRAFT_550636 [Cokeromyces recurvatus]KAI7904245.1 hypothetical protein BX663DRAFT_550636 [Cokeromyces recurvatus]
MPNNNSKIRVKKDQKWKSISPVSNVSFKEEETITKHATCSRQDVIRRQNKLTTFIPRRKTMIKQYHHLLTLHGLDHDALYRRLIYEDSKLDQEVTHLRWIYGFRFCAYFILKGNRKVARNQILIGNDHHNGHTQKVINLNQFPGLSSYLLSKEIIDSHLLESPLDENAIQYFNNHKIHQRQISPFLYAFCAFLYSFLPNEKQKYKINLDPNRFKIFSSRDSLTDNDMTIKVESEEDKIHTEFRLSSPFVE